MATEAKRHKNFFIQYDYSYDIHDGEGHRMDKWGLGHIPSAQEWFNLRFEGLRNLIIPKGERKIKGSVEGVFLGVVHDDDFIKSAKPGETWKRKPLHMHVIICLKVGKTQKAMMDFLGITRKKNCDPVKDKAYVSKYELHVGDKSMIVDGKTVYGENKLFDFYGFSMSARQLWHKFIKPTKKEKELAKTKFKAKALQVALDDRKNEVKMKAVLALSKREMTLNQVKERFYLADSKKGGLGATGVMDFVKDKRDLETAQEIALLEKHEAFKKDGRKLITIMFSGQGGSGKSTVARILGYWADDIHEVHATTLDKQKTVDIPDGYTGENVALIDELRPTSLSPESFFTLFDPSQYSLQSSRNKNKPFTIECALLTQSEPLERWIFDFCTSGVRHDRSFYFFKSLLERKSTDLLYVDALRFLSLEWREKSQQVQVVLEEENSELSLETATKSLNSVYEAYVDFYPQVGRRLTYWVDVSIYGTLKVRRWDKKSFSFKPFEIVKCPEVPKFNDNMNEKEKSEALKKARENFKGMAYQLGIMRPKWVEDLGANLIEELADLPF